MSRAEILTIFQVASKATFNFSLHQFLYTKALYILPQSKWFYVFSLLMRYSTTLNKVFFVDLNAFEVNKNLAFKTELSTNLAVLMHTFYSTKFGQKIIILTHSTLNIFNKTLSRLFQNVLWAEREIGEMFGIFFEDKKDNRRLLLDFSFIGNPMLKSYPVTGFTEIYYNPFKQWLEYVICLFLEGEKINNGFDN